jgi:hypothetical protein
MPITYTLISHGKNILCQHESRDNTHKNVQTVQKMLDGLPRHDTRSTYQGEKVLFHTIVENEFVYLACTDDAFAEGTAYAFLGELKENFCKRYASPGKKYPDASVQCKEFSNTIVSLASKFNSADVSKVAEVRDRINQVQEVMTQNLERVVGRGEQINRLVEKTDAVVDAAVTFKKGATDLKNEMRWRRIRMIIAAVGVTFVIAVILFFVVCKGLSCTK